jgi:hypothetical protein
LFENPSASTLQLANVSVELMAPLKSTATPPLFSSTPARTVKLSSVGSA